MSICDAFFVLHLSEEKNHSVMARIIQEVQAGWEAIVSFADKEGAFTLMLGQASVFGCPLRANVKYSFCNRGIPIFTTTGCRIEVVSGDVRVGIHDSAIEEIHMLLEQDRKDSLAADRGGPRVLIVGEVDTGKSSLARTLCNLAVASNALNSRRVGGKTERAADGQDEEDVAPERTAISFVDLDIGQQSLSCPGTICTAFIDEPLAVDDNFNSVMPLVFFLGEPNPSYPGVFDRYLDCMAHTRRCIDSLQSTDFEHRRGGTIINTMGWVKGLGLEIIRRAIEVFQVTHVIVTGANIELFDTMRQVTMDDPRGVSVLHYRSPVSMFKRNQGVRRAARDSLMENYFYGSGRVQLVPSRVTVKLQDVAVLNAVTLEPLMTLIPFTLCAVSLAASEDEVSSANVAGFVILTDIGHQALGLLSPSPGPLPGRFLLASNTISAPESLLPPL